VYHTLERYYDAILVYGVPQVMDVITAYHLPASVAARTRYCGYLPRPRPDVPSATTRAALCAQDERLVLVTAGGGGDGYLLLRTYLEGLATLEAPLRAASVVITGPFMAAEQRAELETLAAHYERCRLMDFTTDLLSIMQAADLVVCMGGYNTLCEALSLGARALVVPRAAPRREQLLRAVAFERLGLVSMVHPDALDPGLLARRVGDMLREAEDGARSDLSAARAAFVASGALDGLGATSRAVAELLDQAVPASTEVS
jgi:predicted glycosyltransferase